LKNIDQLIIDAYTRFLDELTQAQSFGELNSIIHRVGYEDLLVESDYWLDTLPYGKVLVMGDLSMKINELQGCFKSYGIDKKRIVHISFEEVKNYDISRLEYSDVYRLILVGPVPHSAKGMGNESSVITSLENNPNITKVKRLMSGNELKISKESLKKSLEEEIDSGYLQKG